MLQCFLGCFHPQKLENLYRLQYNRHHWKEFKKNDKKWNFSFLKVTKKLQHNTFTTKTKQTMTKCGLFVLYSTQNYSYLQVKILLCRCVS